MRKKILTMSLVVVMVLCFTACAEETEEEVELPSAQEIIDGAVESFDNIRTYQFELDMTMDATDEAEGEVLEHTVTMVNSGTLDLENLQMKTDLSAGSGDEMMRVESYIIDGMVYARPEAPDIEEPVWMKSEAPAEYWEMMIGVSGLENYIEILKTAQVEVTGSEQVKGVDCYVLQLTPEMAELYQTAMDPVGGIGQAGMLPPVPEELLEDMFRSSSVQTWIAKDTYFLMKAEIDMAIETTPELMDYLGEEAEISLDITISFLAYNYNQPVTIVVPQEALEASEMPTE
jgi:outer membrane lipoprotein-sorting protein